jgi:hypothetical protein
MKIRLSGTPDRVAAVATVMRSAFRVREESRDFRDDPPSPKVRRYLHIDLLPVAKPTPEPAAIGRAADADARAVVEHFLGAFIEDPDDTVIEAIDTRRLTVGNLRDLVAGDCGGDA